MLSSAMAHAKFAKNRHFIGKNQWFSVAALNHFFSVVTFCKFAI